MEGGHKDGGTLREVEHALKMCLRINIDTVNTKAKRLSRNVTDEEPPTVTIE